MNNNSDIEKILNSKGFLHVLSCCQNWLENKIEHIRAYSPEEKQEMKNLIIINNMLEDVKDLYLKS